MTEKCAGYSDIVEPSLYICFFWHWSNYIHGFYITFSFSFWEIVAFYLLRLFYLFITVLAGSYAPFHFTGGLSMWIPLYFLLITSLHILLSGNVSSVSVVFISLMSVLYFFLLFFAWFADEHKEGLTPRPWHKRGRFLGFVAWYCLPVILNGVAYLLQNTDYHFWTNIFFSWRYHIWLTGTAVLVLVIIYMIRSDYSLRYKRRVKERMHYVLRPSHLRIHDPEE